MRWRSWSPPRSGPCTNEARDAIFFDLWLAVEHAGLAPVAIAACFAPYRPDGWSKPLAIDNLTDKVSDRRFVDDLSLLIPTWPPNYTLEAGAEVAQAVIAAIDD